jgi:hypothetical protein
MEAIFSAADDAGHAQHAPFIRARQFVLEVSGDHVADLSERVPYLFCGVGRVPNIFLAIWPAVFASQQTVRIPHRAPAKPIMAVN